MVSSLGQTGRTPLCASKERMRALRPGSLQFFTKAMSASVLPRFLAEYPLQGLYYRPAESLALEG